MGNKATEIEKACNLTAGAPGYCSKEITDAFTFYQTPEGFYIPKSMIEDRELVMEIATDEEAAETENHLENQRKINEQKEKEQRAEVNRKHAEKRKKKKADNNQMELFDD